MDYSLCMMADFEIALTSRLFGVFITNTEKFI